MEKNMETTWKLLYIGLYTDYMSYSLNFLKGGDIGDYIGEYYRGS